MEKLLKELMPILGPLLEQFTGQNSVFKPGDIRCIGLSLLSHNFNVAAQRGRPIFASGLARDVRGIEGMQTGGFDFNTILMLLPLIMPLINKFVGTDKAQVIGEVVEEVEEAAPRWFKDFVVDNNARLDAIESV